MSMSGNQACRKCSAGIVFLSIGVSTLFTFGMHLGSSKEVGERRGGTVEMGEGQVLGIRQGYPLEDQEIGALHSGYTDAHPLLVHILYADIDDQSLLLPHHHHE